MKTDTLDQILTAKNAKEPIIRLVDLESGLEELISREAVEHHSLSEDLKNALRHDKSTVIQQNDKRLFLQVFNTPLRLIIIGGAHISQPLAQMALQTGFDVTILDPREPFATQARFPGMSISHAWPDSGMKALQPDARTAVVALTHDPKLDDPGLIEALRSSAFYVGALGSSRTHAKRLERLADAGMSEQSGRIHGPVGLDIGAQSPAEIAVSILAEIVHELRKRQ